ncbi:EF-hand domain-containing protein [Streptomyces sp. NPDC101150]|uniref:EF-hand domain-containing protein n=1 Tax=Streptomyces sp. NPDC101150 TaxID=3366114 RepID=UPI00380D3F2C
MTDVMIDEMKLRDKYAHRFHTRDVDRDGYVSGEDFAERTRRVARAMGESAHSPRSEAAVAGTLATWAQTARLAGAEPDASLSREQFIDAYARAYAEGKVAEMVRPSIEGHVALVDQDGDGMVDEEEFVRGQEAVGMDKETAREAFKRLDTDGNGRLTVDEWTRAVVSYYTTTAPDAPGDLVLGWRG